MQEQELVNKIRDYIKTHYNAEYNGYINVEKLETGYKLSIGIPSYMSPTTISMDTENEEEFLNYIYSELRRRNYVRVDFYKVKRQNELREE